jgi:hypothetical protein
MTIAQTIGRRVAAAEAAKGAADFARLAHAILKNDGKLSQLQGDIDKPNTFNSGLGHLADIVRFGGHGEISRTELQKAAQTPNSLGADTAFQAYVQISDGFLGSLVNAGAFDAMLPAMLRIPLIQANVGAVSTAATAFQITEQQMKQLSRLSFTNVSADPLKAICAFIVSKELARFSPPGTLQLIESELRKAVAKVSDQIFISIVASGVSANASTGATGEAVRADISAMLEQVTLGQDSRPFIVTTSLVCKRWCMLSDQHGNSAFPVLGPQGGTINQVPILVSDAVSSGLAYLIDASSIGANSGELRLVEAEHASLQFNDVPDSPPGAITPYLSMWQLNLVGLRVERYFIVERLRSNSVAAVSNSNSWASGNSPP